MEDVIITTEYIKLQQALKLGGLVMQGSDVKFLLEEGAILVNGETASERGKKIRNNDIVELKGVGKIRIICE